MTEEWEELMPGEKPFEPPMERLMRNITLYVAKRFRERTSNLHIELMLNKVINDHSNPKNCYEPTTNTDGIGPLADLLEFLEGKTANLGASSEGTGIPLD